MVQDSDRGSPELNSRHTGRAAPREPIFTKRNALVLVGALMLIGVIFLQAERDRPPWVLPAEYTQSAELSSTLAYQWSTPGSEECNTFESCFALNVVTRDGCETLNATITLLDSEGRNVGSEEERASDVRAGEVARVVFGFTTGNVKSARIGKLRCY